MSSRGRSCATCDVYYPTASNRGTCRRYPPRVLLAPVKQNPGSFYKEQVMPSVAQDYWCGEWAPIGDDEN